MADPTPASYCANCKKLAVCKFTSKISAFDTSVKAFNTENAGAPIRISITSNNYTCRHKEAL